MAASLQQACVDLAWSQWVALGVSGSAAPPNHPVDLEGAIVFAPQLETLDPRLYGEALDWCCKFGKEATSLARLKQTLKLYDSEHRQKFEQFAAVVNRHAGTNWPTNVSAENRQLRSKSQFRYDAPAAIQLRARLVFGISARADLIVALLGTTASVQLGALDALLYTKRNLAEAMSALVFGGLVDGRQSHNRYFFRLLKQAALEEILSPLPPQPYRPFAHRLAAAAAMLSTYQRTQAKSDRVRAVELAKTSVRARAMLDAVLDEHESWEGKDPEEGISRWLLPLLVA